MQSRLRALRRFAAVLAALTGLTGALFLTGPTAQAQSVESGSLSLTSDPGDYLGQGESHTYSTGADTFTVSGSSQSVSVQVTTAGGEQWQLHFGAPPGEDLVPGLYANARNWPYTDDTWPEMTVFGPRGCDQVNGFFTVSDVTVDPNGYVRQFDATFEEHCDGADPALHGEVHITNPPPPPPPPALSLEVSVAADGTASAVNGNAAVHGTVTCSEPVYVVAGGNLTQVVHHTIIKGYFSTSLNCTPGAPVPWTATAVPNGTTPFQRGDAVAATDASATDPVYKNTVTIYRNYTVDLKYSHT